MRALRARAIPPSPKPTVKARAAHPLPALAWPGFGPRFGLNSIRSDAVALRFARPDPTSGSGSATFCFVAAGRARGSCNHSSSALFLFASAASWVAARKGPKDTVTIELFLPPAGRCPSPRTRHFCDSALESDDAAAGCSAAAQRSLRRSRSTALETSLPAAAVVMLSLMLAAVSVHSSASMRKTCTRAPPAQSRESAFTAQTCRGSFNVYLAFFCF